jgi:hypothetical protein
MLQGTKTTTVFLNNIVLPRINLRSFLALSNGRPGSKRKCCGSQTAKDPEVLLSIVKRICKGAILES